MNILSLFDGVSCGRIALERAGIKVDKYYASEIDKPAQAVSRYKYPDIIRLGDVTEWPNWGIDWGSIDLLIGGSPCQGFSFAGKQLAFDDPRSKLFFVFEDIYKYIKSLNPDVKVMLENVRMKKEHLDVISERLGVTPTVINSALVSAQNRIRYYWTEEDITQPEDKHIFLRDILQPEEEIDEKYYLKDGWLEWFNKNREYQLSKKYSSLDADKAITMTARQYASWNGNFVSCVAQRGRNIVDGKRKDYKGAPTEQRLEPRHDGKTNCLTTVQKDNYILIVPEATKKGYVEIKPGEGVDLTFPNSETRRGRRMEDKCNCLTATKYDYCHFDGFRIRRLTPIECERLQTVPDNYTAFGIDEKGNTIKISDSQRYKMLGNGWTVAVISHIFKEMINAK